MPIALGIFEYIFVVFLFFFFMEYREFWSIGADGILGEMPLAVSHNPISMHHLFAVLEQLWDS